MRLFFPLPLLGPPVITYIASASSLPRVMGMTMPLLVAISAAPELLAIPKEERDFFF